MKVIGAGFGRTGTMSLKAALERLGYGPCYHMIDLLESPERAPGWRAAAEGEEVDWDSLLDGYEATVDWPEHNERVKATVPSDRLLVHEIADG